MRDTKKYTKYCHTKNVCPSARNHLVSNQLNSVFNNDSLFIQIAITDKFLGGSFSKFGIGRQRHHQYIYIYQIPNKVPEHFSPSCQIFKYDFYHQIEKLTLDAYP